MKRIYISHGDKGGVGKSIVAAVLTEFLLKDDTPVSLVEGDPSQPDVGIRYMDDPAVRLGALPLNRAGDAETAMADLSYWLEQEAGDQVVINLPAGASETLDQLAEPLRMVADALGYTLYCTYSLGKGDTPAAGLAKSLNSGVLRYIDPAHRLALFPAFQGKQESFAWYSHKARKDADLRESVMPALSPRAVFDKMLHARGRIRTLAQEGGEGILVYDKIAMHRWLQQSFAALAPILKPEG